MKVIFVIAAVLLTLGALLPQAQAIDGGSTVSFNHATYHTCFPNIALVISAGCADWWVDSPRLMAPGRTGAITSPSCMAYTGYNNCYVMTATVSTNVNPLVALTIVNGGTSYGGCHVVGGSAPPATSVLQTVVRTFFIGVDEGSVYCGGVMLLTLQTGGTQTPIANVAGTFEFAVPYQDNQVRLCNASEFTTDTVHPDTGSVLYPKRNACTTPSLNVEICPETQPCFVQTNSTITLMGNLSFNQTNLPPITEEGWDGSLYIFLLVFAAIVAWFGEAKRDNYYRAFAGFVLLVAAFVAIWEIDRIGFDNFGRGAWFAIAFLLVELPLAFYLLIPKNFEKETKN